MLYAFGFERVGVLAGARAGASGPEQAAPAAAESASIRAGWL